MEEHPRRSSNSRTEAIREEKNVETGCNDARELNNSTLQQYWGFGVPDKRWLWQEIPFCQVELDRSYRGSYSGDRAPDPEPDVTRFKNVSFVGDSPEYLVARNHRAGQGQSAWVFALVLTIADELQKHRVPPAAAVATGISTHLNVFANRPP